MIVAVKPLGIVFLFIASKTTKVRACPTKLQHFIKEYCTRPFVPGALISPIEKRAFLTSLKKTSTIVYVFLTSLLYRVL